MKEIFSFELPYQIKSKVTKTNDDGSELTTLENVTKKIKVIIKEPTRIDVENAKCEYQKAWSKCIRDGILTRAIVDKQYRASHGILTDDEQKKLENIATRIRELKVEYKKLDENKSKTEKEEIAIKELIEEFSGLQSELDQLEAINESLYENTAETIAANKQLAYNIFSLTFIERDGKLENFVKGNDLEEKLISYDSIVEDESSDEKKERARLYSEILTRNSQYISWLSRGRITKEQLKEVNDSLDKPKDLPDPVNMELDKEKIDKKIDKHLNETGKQAKKLASKTKIEAEQEDLIKLD